MYERSAHVKGDAVIDVKSTIEALANSFRRRIIERNGLDRRSFARATDLFAFFFLRTREPP